MTKNNKETQLQIIVREGGLEPSKAKYFLDNFQHYFNLADEWSIKAKMIKVTDPSQQDDMKMARTGRLILREKRIDVEKARKRLKEDYLRGGKLVDHIAGVLKELILPIENYLDRQEHFVEIQAEEKREAIRLEVEKRIEDERIAKEKADAEALEKAHIENEKLKAEAVIREKKRKEAEERQRKINEKATSKLLKEKKEKARLETELKEQEKEAEEKAHLEREKQEKTLANERAKAKRLKEIADEKAQAEKEKSMAKLEAERKEKERLEELLKNQIICPNCGHKFQLKEKK